MCTVASLNCKGCWAFKFRGPRVTYIYVYVLFMGEACAQGTFRTIAMRERLMIGLIVQGRRASALSTQHTYMYVWNTIVYSRDQYYVFCGRALASAFVERIHNIRLAAEATATRSAFVDRCNLFNDSKNRN